MKKLLISLFAFGMCFGLTACGQKEETSNDTASKTETTQEKESKEEKKTIYQGFYSATIPEGWTFLDEYNNDHIDRDDNDDYTIKLGVKTGTPQSVVDSQTQREGYTQGEDVTIGNYTYKVVNFLWEDDTPSTILYTPAPGLEDKVISVHLFMMTPEDKDAKTFLESIEYEEDAYEKYLETCWE